MSRHLRVVPIVVFLMVTVIGCRTSGPTVALLEPPGRDMRARIDGDTAILVNGRRVTPAGRVLRTESYAWGLTLSPDGSRAAVLHKDAFELVDLRPPYTVRRVPPNRETRNSRDENPLGDGSYMGCAFSPDGKTFYYGSANEGRIIVLDVATVTPAGSIEINTGGFDDSFAGDLTLSRDGRRLFVVDQFNYRLVTVDVATRRVVQSVRVGRNPFAVALSADEKSAWVSNVGMFEYPLVPGVTTKETRTTAGLPFPAYGVPSKEAEDGVDVNGVRIPGLGSPNHPDAMSVFQVDLTTGKVVQRIKTGYLVGVDREDIKTVGGASPGAVVVGRTRVYVANATNDTISIIDAANGARIGEIELTVPGLERLRGVLPFGMALAAGEQRLYVACAGLNAVAVIDLATQKVEGYVPAGWFPSMVALGDDGRTLVVSSAKGLGSGPNGGPGFVDPPRGAAPGDVMQGTLQIVPVPAQPQLAALTKQVIANTYQVRQSQAADLSAIKHVVFIVKENRTFDQVYGQRRGIEGDASLAGLGLRVAVRSKDGSRAIDTVDVSPNHHALANQFAISDNFYCDSDQSNTGHRWVVGVYPNEWVEVNARSRIEARLFSSAPGRRYVNGSSATILPEDYNEAGALWEHLARHDVPFYNFGFGTEMPGSIEAQMFKETGIRMTVSFPLPKPLFDRTSRTFPTFNMAIPDQYRVDMFEAEMRERWESSREPFPKLVTMVLTQDHLTDEHPAEGYPFRESYMADNDLALGRVMQTLSHSRWWPEMLVIVTEDDPQGGRDHVEAHRSILLLAGPRVRHGYVSPTLASFGSIMRLIFQVLGVPPLNQFDAAASLPLDFFAATPDLTPYVATPVDRRLFDPNAALKPFDRWFNWKGLGQSQAMDDPDDMRRQFPPQR